MRVAALYDIHGNLPALEAVLAEVRGADVDLVVVGGDVLPGPMPRETLACLDGLEIPARYLRGNGDRAVLEERAGLDPAFPRAPEPPCAGRRISSTRTRSGGWRAGRRRSASRSPAWARCCSAMPRRATTPSCSPA